MQFGKLLRDLRDDLEPPRTQSEVGTAMGFTQQKVSYLETGTYQPTLEELRVICQYYRVSADYLLGFAAPFPFPQR